MRFLSKQAGDGSRESGEDYLPSSTAAAIGAITVPRACAARVWARAEWSMVKGIIVALRQACPQTGQMGPVAPGTTWEMSPAGG